MACTLSNKCAKNVSKRTVPLQLIIKNVVTCFLEHSVVALGIMFGRKQVNKKNPENVGNIFAIFFSQQTQVLRPTSWCKYIPENPPFEQSWRVTDGRKSDLNSRALQLKIRVKVLVDS